MDGRTNLFFVAGSGIDIDGDGLSDSYEHWVIHSDPFLGDTGTNGIPDGYKDAESDGWITLDEFRQGQDPFAVNSPPPLLGVFQTRDAANLNVVEWSPPTATTTSFTVERSTGSGWQTAGTVVAGETSFTDTNLPPGTSASYRVAANYPAGSSLSVSTVLPSTDPLYDVPAAIARGPGGRLHFLCARPPEGFSDFLITRTPYPSIHPKDKINSVNPNYPTNAFYGSTNPPLLALPTNLLTAGSFLFATPDLPFYGYYQMSIAGRGLDGRLGNWRSSGLLSYQDATPFLDGRQHMLDNLIFGLRAGSSNAPFNFHMSTLGPWLVGSRYGVWPGYVVAGFHWKWVGSPVTTDPYDPFQPFEDGSILRVFRYNPDRFDAYGNPMDTAYGGNPAAPIMNNWDQYFSSLACARSGSTNLPVRWLDPTYAPYRIRFC